MDVLRGEILATALRVGEQRVAAVDDEVSRFEQRRELVDHGVHRRARLDHDHRLARTLERADKFLHRLGGNDVLVLGAALGEFFRDRSGAVEHRDGEALALHVQDEVFAHDGEADEPDVAVAGRSCHNR